MLKLFSVFLFLIFSTHSWSVLDLDEAPPGEQRIKLSKKDFKTLIATDENESIEIKTYLDKFSFVWVRTQKILLVPKARIKIRIKNNPALYSARYKDKIISFQGKSKRAYTELFVSLYEKDPINIFKDNKQVAQIRVVPKKQKSPRVLVDYTCSRNGIEVLGLENEHFSMGCQTKRIGKFGGEKPMLEVKWLSPELQIVDDEIVPYNAVFLSSYPVKIKVKNIFTNITKEITIKAKIPKRLHRLFTAYGFGPYAFNTETDDKNGKRLKASEGMAPALFFYLNYKISETNSIRGFDAAVFKDSKFNNAGMYLGSDFGFALDNKLYFTTLLGVQYLYFRFDEDNPEISEAIFPQGIEFMYRHAFDIPNYIISGGIFLSTTDAIDYENVWIRWGKNYFWELNLIAWEKDEFQVRTWGVSVGFPFKGFL